MMMEVFELSSSDEQLVLLLVKKRRRLYSHTILQARDKEKEFHLSIQEVKLYHDRLQTCLWISVGQFDNL